MSSPSQISSLPAQLEIISRFAADNGYAIVQTYQDVGRSGLSQSRREGLAQLLRDIQREVPFTTLLVMDVTRWGRYQNPDEAAYLEFMCQLAGVKVKYCAEAFADDSTLASSIQKSIRRVMAAEYSRQLSDRSRAGKRRAALTGGRQGSVAPYGFGRYAVDDSGLLELLAPGERAPRPDQEVRTGQGPAAEVSTVQRIFDLFVNQRCNVREIADLLNREGVPHRNSAPWIRRRVISVLRNEQSMGIECFNRTETRLLKTKSNPPSEWIRVQAFDPIVDPALFRAAAAKLRACKGRRFSNAEMIDRLRQTYRKYGTLSTAIINSEPYHPKACVYIKRFSSLTIAYRLAGHNPRNGRTARPSIALCGSAEIVRRLADLYARHGRLTRSIIDASPHLPRGITIARHFGGLTKAYALVGCARSRKPYCRKAETPASSA